jgi:dienelactone hydrolase
MRRALLTTCLAVSVLSGRLAAQPVAPADQWLARPVDDRTFKTYLEFFTYDRALPFDIRVSKTEESEGLRSERLSFQSTPGVRVTAVLRQPTGGASAPRPAIVLLHGGTAAGKDAPGPSRMAELLARAGWSVLAIDMPYFGERATDLFTTFSEQDKHDRLYNQPSAYLAWVTQVVKDVSRSVDLLVAERGAAANRLVLVGMSRGAIAASIVGATERRFAGVVLLFGGHFDALETNHLPAACPANYIGRIAPRRLLMINGTQDSDMIRDTAVEPLFKLARQPKQIIWTEGGHAVLTEEHRAAIVQWLRETTK